jgi:hyperosmotically inducible periplasmic protein
VKKRALSSNRVGEFLGKGAKMRRSIVAIFGILVITVAVGSTLALGGQTLDERDFENQIRKALVTLPYYGVFDNLAFTVNGGTVTLEGQVVRPSTKSDAKSRVAKLKGVETVVDNIKVLPLSPDDNRLRRILYRTIFRTPQLSKYSLGTNPSIHIIVDSGHVTLIGIVDNEGDKNIAGIRANTVGGIFSVTNDLRVEGKNK